MTFTEALVAAGYFFDDENFDDAYVKKDSEGFYHLYQEGEEEGLWNYVKMTEDFDVIKEVTFDPESTTVTVIQ